jgi:hypothetical protein
MRPAIAVNGTPRLTKPSNTKAIDPVSHGTRLLHSRASIRSSISRSIRSMKEFDTVSA